MQPDDLIALNRQVIMTMTPEGQNPCPSTLCPAACCWA
ncbi:hypothetical protein SynBMKMC1_01068 [Synechococcus sp. BMK-MC-1]|nr:hypothetical protein SynBMKMC1_01068 [Synechococcus sp. BMK-MC-1]